MIVDSSALLAVILNEADEPRFAAAMIDAPALRMSAANWVEAAIVVDSHRNPAAKVRFDDLVDALRLRDRACHGRRMPIEPAPPIATMGAAIIRHG